MPTYSALNINIEDQMVFRRYQNTVTTGTVSGAFTQSLTYSNSYVFNLSAGATFSYSNPAVSNYTFIVNAGTYVFNLSSASTFMTQGGTAVGLTGSFVLSGIYDGSKMWLSTPATNFIAR